VTFSVAVRAVKGGSVRVSSSEGAIIRLIFGIGSEVLER